MVEKKKVISQRWGADFHQRVKDLSEKVNLSVTDLTIEGLEILLKLGDIIDLFHISTEERIQKVSDGVRKGYSKSPEYQYTHESEPGYVMERIKSYLKENHGKMIATTQISRDLKIPQSTVRRSVQDLASETNFKVILGRPNYIGYNIG